MKVRVVVEIAGHPKEHVEEVMKQILEKVRKDYKVIEDQLVETKEIKGLWSTFFEALMEFKGINEMVLFCFDYMPSSVQIEEPENFTVTNNEFNNLFNDVMAKLHVYDAVTKNARAQNTILEQKLKKALSSIHQEMKEIDKIAEEERKEEGKDKKDNKKNKKKSSKKK